MIGRWRKVWYPPHHWFCEAMDSSMRCTLVDGPMYIDISLLFRCPSTIDNPPPLCASDKETLFRGNDYCGLIKVKSGVFWRCFGNAGFWSLAAAYHKNCMHDTCANQNDLTLAKEAACGSLEVLAADCASKVRVGIWREAAGCRE